MSLEQSCTTGALCWCAEQMNRQSAQKGMKKDAWTRVGMMGMVLMQEDRSLVVSVVMETSDCDQWGNADIHDLRQNQCLELSD